MLQLGTLEYHPVLSALPHEPRRVQHNIDTDGSELAARSHPLGKFFLGELPEVVEEVLIPRVLFEEAIEL